MLATVGNLRVQSPVAQGGVTAVGFHGAADGALVLQPVGPQSNEGLLARLWHRITGSSRRGLAWYQLESGTLRTLDVGAVAGTDVYSPVDGTVVAIRDHVVSGRTVGAEIELRPTSAPSLVVAIENVKPDPALSVGANVAAGSSKLGTRHRHQPLRAAGAPGGTPLTAATTSRSGSIPRRPSAYRSLPALRILFIADVVGAPGRGALAARLKTLRSELEIDVCIVNGENAADGIGITPRLADQLLAMGADAITLGNHAFRRTEIGAYLDSSDCVVRPANTSANTPGRGLAIVPTANGSRLAVINVLGSLFLHPRYVDVRAHRRPRRAGPGRDTARPRRRACGRDQREVALARWLDGRVTAVIGTHTHVQTSDATLLPRGTAFITDAGMTGPHDSVIGVESDLAIRRMRTGLLVRFVTAQGDVRIEGALVDCDAETGKASSIEALRYPFP